MAIERSFSTFRLPKLLFKPGLQSILLAGTESVGTASFAMIEPP
jgi:hypothetical protein